MVSTIFFYLILHGFCVWTVSTEQLFRRKASECYGNNYWCNRCFKTYSKDTFLYHCEVHKECEYHQFGYDLCEDCAKVLRNDDNYLDTQYTTTSNTNNNDNHKSTCSESQHIKRIVHRLRASLAILEHDVCANEEQEHKDDMAKRVDNFEMQYDPLIVHLSDVHNNEISSKLATICNLIKPFLPLCLCGSWFKHGSCDNAFICRCCSKSFEKGVETYYCKNTENCLYWKHGYNLCETCALVYKEQKHKMRRLTDRITYRLTMSIAHIEREYALISGTGMAGNYGINGINGINTISGVPTGVPSGVPINTLSVVPSGTPAISHPSNWDELDIRERTKRIEAWDSLVLRYDNCEQYIQKCTWTHWLYNVLSVDACLDEEATYSMKLRLNELGHLFKRHVPVCFCGDVFIFVQSPYELDCKHCFKELKENDKTYFCKSRDDCQWWNNSYYLCEDCVKELRRRHDPLQSATDRIKERLTRSRQILRDSVKELMARDPRNPKCQEIDRYPRLANHHYAAIPGDGRDASNGTVTTMQNIQNMNGRQPLRRRSKQAKLAQIRREREMMRRSGQRTSLELRKPTEEEDGKRWLKMAYKVDQCKQHAEKLKAKLLGLEANNNTNGNTNGNGNNGMSANSSMNMNIQSHKSSMVRFDDAEANERRDHEEWCQAFDHKFERLVFDVKQRVPLCLCGAFFVHETSPIDFRCRHCFKLYDADKVVIHYCQQQRDCPHFNSDYYLCNHCAMSLRLSEPNETIKHRAYRRLECSIDIIKRAVDHAKQTEDHKSEMKQQMQMNVDQGTEWRIPNDSKVGSPHCRHGQHGQYGQYAQHKRRNSNSRSVGVYSQHHHHGDSHHRDRGLKRRKMDWHYRDCQEDEWKDVSVRVYFYEQQLERLNHHLYHEERLQLKAHLDATLSVMKEHLATCLCGNLFVSGPRYAVFVNCEL